MIALRPEFLADMPWLPSAGFQVENFLVPIGHAPVVIDLLKTLARIHEDYQRNLVLHPHVSFLSSLSITTDPHTLVTHASYTLAPKKPDASKQESKADARFCELFDSFFKQLRVECETHCPFCGEEAGVWHPHGFQYYCPAHAPFVKEPPSEAASTPRATPLIVPLGPIHQDRRFALFHDPKAVERIEHSTVIRPENASNFSSDEQRFSQAIAKIREAGGTHRTLARLPEDWEAILTRFLLRYPNFGPLSEVLSDQFALEAMGDGCIQWQPIVLNGPPGIGKSAAVRWLARNLRTPFESLDIASTQSGSALSGSESFWINSKPGIVFETLAYKEVANPVILLDEIEKGDAGGVRSLAALLPLLETESARCFQDLSLPELPLDASRVNWIATSNEVSRLSAPIRSRLLVLDIKAPSDLELIQIAPGVYSDLLDEHSWGKAFVPVLSEAVLEQLPTIGAVRDLRRVMLSALAHAAREKRTEILVRDLHVVGTPSA